MDDVVEANHISCQTKELSIIQIRSLELIVLHKHGLMNPITQEESFPISFFNKMTVNMTLRFEVEEEIDEEDGRQQNSSREMNKTLATLEAILLRLN